MNNEQQKFYDECVASGKFNRDQTEEIRWGFKYGLTPEQVAIFADPKFDWDQMAQIRWGFEYGLTPEQVAIYADTKFNWWQMEEIRLGFEHRLTPEQVAIYADVKFEWDQMEQIRCGFEHRLTPLQVATFADPKFDGEQMEQIRLDFENGLTTKFYQNCQKSKPTNTYKVQITAHRTIYRTINSTSSEEAQRIAIERYKNLENFDYGTTFIQAEIVSSEVLKPKVN